MHDDHAVVPAVDVGLGPSDGRCGVYDVRVQHRGVERFRAIPTISFPLLRNCGLLEGIGLAYFAIRNKFVESCRIDRSDVEKTHVAQEGSKSLVKGFHARAVDAGNHDDSDTTWNSEISLGKGVIFGGRKPR